jgi:hypothetical protein
MTLITIRKDHFLTDSIPDPPTHKLSIISELFQMLSVMHSLDPASASDLSSASGKIRRPHNAYNLFFMEQLAELKKGFPTITGNEASRELGRRWKSMSREQRQPYVDRALEIRTQFRVENPDWHYERRSPHAKPPSASEHMTSNFLGFLNGDHGDDPQVAGLLSILGSQMIAHFVLQNKDITDAVLGSIHSTTLTELLENTS